MKIELGKFATGFMFGATTMTILKLIYGPTGWNALIMFTILTAYFVGRSAGPETGKEREIFLRSYPTGEETEA